MYDHYKKKLYTGADSKLNLWQIPFGEYQPMGPYQRSVKRTIEGERGKEEPIQSIVTHNVTHNGTNLSAIHIPGHDCLRFNGRWMLLK